MGWRKKLWRNKLWGTTLSMSFSIKAKADVVTYLVGSMSLTLSSPPYDSLQISITNVATRKQPWLSADGTHRNVHHVVAPSRGGYSL